MNGDSEGRLAGIGELRRDIPPSRDLWPDISAAIGGSAPRRRFTVAHPAWAVAAAVACVAVGVWIGRISVPGEPGVTRAGTIPTSVELARQVSYAPGARFERTREQLLGQVTARLAELPPRARAEVEASLETVQRARATIEQALGRDPGNALLQEMLVNSYQDEMRVLTTVRESWVGRQEIGT